jgi:hypothetical protein
VLATTSAGIRRPGRHRDPLPGSPFAYHGGRINRFRRLPAGLLRIRDLRRPRAGHRDQRATVRGRRRHLRLGAELGSMEGDRGHLTGARPAVDVPRRRGTVAVGYRSPHRGNHPGRPVRGARTSAQARSACRSAVINRSCSAGAPTPAWSTTVGPPPPTPPGHVPRRPTPPTSAHPHRHRHRPSPHPDRSRPRRTSSDDERPPRSPSAHHRTVSPPAKAGPDRPPAPGPGCPSPVSSIPDQAEREGAASPADRRDASTRDARRGS